MLIGTSLLDYWCAREITAAKKDLSKQIFLYTSLVSNIGVLFIFKYFVFFHNSSIYIFNLNQHLLNNFIIPAGLSFYTFQSMSYTLDVYRGKYPAKDKLSDFLLFVSFFPHMVAGPIVRYDSLMPQLKTTSWFRNIDWSSFITLTTWGYFKKLVIADNLNLIVTPVFNSVTGYSGLELLIAGFLFVIQVYCDFSGYSDIATGISKLFNINLTLNWRRPLFSKSLREFWTRNHISITTWFRDYLYIGLGGSRVSQPRWLLNVFLVFLISGFWHGANVTFIIWGTLHGIVYVLELLINKKWPQFKAPAFFGWIYLITFHTVSLIAFRALTATDLAFIYRKIFSFGEDFYSLKMLSARQDSFYYAIIIFVSMILFLKEINEEYSLLKSYPRFHRIVKNAAYVSFIILIFILGNFSANTFIYFQF